MCLPILQDIYHRNDLKQSHLLTQLSGEQRVPLLLLVPHWLQPCSTLLLHLPKLPGAWAIKLFASVTLRRNKLECLSFSSLTSSSLYCKGLQRENGLAYSQGRRKKSFTTLALGWFGWNEGWVRYRWKTPRPLLSRRTGVLYVTKLF